MYILVYYNFLLIWFVYEMHSGTSTKLMTKSVRYAPLSITVFVRDYVRYSNSKRFGAMPNNGEATMIYDGCYDVDRDTAHGA